MKFNSNSSPPHRALRIAGLLSLVLTPTIVSAQTPPSLQASAFSRYSITCFAWDSAPVLYYSTFIRKSEIENPDELDLRVSSDLSGEYFWVNRKLSLHPRFPTPPEDYRGLPLINFYRKPPKSKLTFDEKGNQVLRTEISPVASLRLEDSSTPWLLLFRQKPDGGYKIFPIADDPAEYPQGSIRFLNLTSRSPLYAALDRDVKLLPPGEMVPFKNLQTNGDNLLQLRFADPTVSQKKPIYSNAWFHEEDKRFIIFIQNPKTERGRHKGTIDLKVLRYQ